MTTKTKYINRNHATPEQCFWFKEKGLSAGSRISVIKYLKTRKNENPAFSYKKGHLEYGDFMVNNGAGDYSNESYISCEYLEQWQILEWLRVNHNIDLQAICNYSKLGRTYRMGIIFINKDNKVDTAFIRPEDDNSWFIEFESPQEAYSAAFDYIKNNNLI